MPKVIVSGRGGCGKSTVTALLARGLTSVGPVLVVDADESNLGLTSMLGIDAPPQTVMEALGGKSSVRQTLLAALRGDSEGGAGHFDGDLTVDSLPGSCVARDGSLSFVRVGKIEHSMEGCACPMGSVTRSFVKRLSTADGDWVLVDTEAGVEHFGRVVHEGADLVLIIVDPSHEAVLLAERATALAREAGKRTGVVLTKIDDETGPLLAEGLAARDLQVVGEIPYSASLTRANLVGEPLTAASFEGALGLALDRIIDALVDMTDDGRDGSVSLAAAVAAESA